MIMCTYTTLNSQEKALAELPTHDIVNSHLGEEIMPNKEKPLQPPVSFPQKEKNPDLLLKNKPPDGVGGIRIGMSTYCMSECPFVCA